MRWGDVVEEEEEGKDGETRWGEKRKKINRYTKVGNDD